MDQSNPQAQPDLDTVRRRRSTLRTATERLAAALADASDDSAGPSLESIETAARELHASLVAHVRATEGPDGFHAEIVRAAPRLAHDTGILAKEHEHLLASTSEIAERAGTGRTAVDLHALRDIGAKLETAIGRHLQHGSDLIYEAFQADIGGET